MAKYASTQRPRGTTNLQVVPPITEDDRQDAIRYLTRREAGDTLPDIEGWEDGRLAGWLSILGLD